ncbi:hypothetical protein Vi05172_g6121 [Venturia inaequalis]|nr:hypothetical protein Vi05172_g6121 [Venturia inaequalis]
MNKQPPPSSLPPGAGQKPQPPQRPDSVQIAA